VKKGHFEEGTWCKTQSSTMKIMIVVKDPKKNKTLVYVVCGFEYNKGVLVSSLGLRPLKGHVA
jgi:hypothetical protein